MKLFLIFFEVFEKKINSIVIIENFKILNCKNRESNHGLIIQISMFGCEENDQQGQEKNSEVELEF